MIGRKPATGTEFSPAMLAGEREEDFTAALVTACHYITWDFRDNESCFPSRPRDQMSGEGHPVHQTHYAIPRRIITAWGNT